MMKTASFARQIVGAFLVSVALVAPAGAQTAIELHDNRFTPQQDVELGRQAAAEVRQQMPLLRDNRVENFVEDIGERLIGEIPGEWRHPGFEYTFEVVNLKEINAFALPGGPMFLHRGMLEAARTDGEVAGVMAHELSHVILRHGTVQASKAQKFQLGALAGQILGGILGGRTGAVIAQGSQFGLGAYFLKYGREYEREADLLGAQLMARAGYDPREMASMFETIEREGGSRGPEWLSSHPNPGNRVSAINREASMLSIDGRAPRSEIGAVHARLSQLPPAQTMAQVQQANQGRTAGQGQTSARTSVDPPSRQWRTYQPGSFLRLSVPANWQALEGGSGTITYAPQGGYVRTNGGQSAFTHGIQVGVLNQGRDRSLRQKTDLLLQSFAQGNPQLRRQGGYSRTTIDGRQWLVTTLSNVSELTGQREAVNVSTVELSDGSLLFLIGVAPASQAQTYSSTFRRVRQSIQLADR
jgi:hypothetical protein